MPQVAKYREQVLLEDRIRKATTLVKTMRLQLASVRKRNKAERERARRSAKCKYLQEKGESEFLKLMQDVSSGPITVPPVSSGTVKADGEREFFEKAVHDKSQNAIAVSSTQDKKSEPSSSSKSKK